MYGAPELTGATRLAAEGCARMGAGLVTVLSMPEMAAIYRASLPAHIMVRADLDWVDARTTAKLYGSGGLAKPFVYDRNVKTVLDADALKNLPRTLNGHFVLTPHEGEFARAFPHITGDRRERALKAAQETGACVVLKGSQTVIAAADGRVVVNDHACPYLATAGSGDVLAGMIVGLLAQGMAPFEASCAAVWIHGACGLRFGAGLVASDLVGLIPDVLKEMLGFLGEVR